MDNPFVLNTDDRYKAYIDSFREQGAAYWLLSRAELPTLARCRNDIPLNVVCDVTEEEAAEICAEIRKRLQNQEFYEIYIKVLVYFKDTSALDVLKELVKYYKEKERVFKRKGITCKIERRLLKAAIKHLKRVR